MKKVRKILKIIETCKGCPNCLQIGVDSSSAVSCSTISSNMYIPVDSSSIPVISSSTPTLPGYFAGGCTIPKNHVVDKIGFGEWGTPAETGQCSIKKKSVDMSTMPDWCPLEEATKPEIIITKLKLEVDNESECT